jgi:outer membrane protein assembly factor BamC
MSRSSFPTPKVLLLLAALPLAGCQTVSNIFEGGRADHRNAGRLPPLEVPPDLTRPAQGDRFHVPELGTATTLSEFDRKRQAKPQAGEGAVLPVVDRVRIERAGTERWLVVPSPPERVFPFVREFLLEAGHVIALERPESGLIETEWAEIRPRVPEGGIRGLFDRILTSVRSSGLRDKYLVRLDRGTAPDTTEVYISHRGLEEVQISPAANQFMWQPRPSEPELEAEMLRRLMVRFGVPEAVAKARVVEPPQFRARLSKGPDGATLLVVDDDFDRAWRRVGLALDRLGFSRDDQDRSKGLFFVRYADVDAAPQKPGMLSRLAFWRTETTARKAEQFRIQVAGFEAGSRIQVLTGAGTADRSETAARILKVLFEQLR